MRSVVLQSVRVVGLSLGWAVTFLLTAFVVGVLSLAFFVHAFHEAYEVYRDLGVRPYLQGPASSAGGWSPGVARGLMVDRPRFHGATPMDEFVQSKEDQRREDPPVTGVASRRVESGREGEFEDWISGILDAVKGSPGYLGSDVLRPTSAEDGEYRILYRFDHASNLERWEASDERRRWLDRAEPLVKEQKIGRLTGLETWFTLPSKVGEPAPPRYKMVVVTWMAVFPLATVLFLLLQPLLGGAPTVLRTLVFTLVMVTTMTYIVMPRMTRLFSFWLYPKK